MTQEPLTQPPQNERDARRQALLVEYQACQHDNSSTSLSYWTLAGIFIGVSSVVLGWLLYALITRVIQVFSLSIVISVVGGAVIAILCFLIGWLKRINYLSDRNYERMREIELELGMWKSWRIHSLDKWKKLGFKKPEKLTEREINQQWKKMEVELQKGISEKYFKRLFDRKEEIIKLCNRYKPQRRFERRTRDWLVKVIFGAIISLWCLVIVIVWLPHIKAWIEKLIQ